MMQIVTIFHIFLFAYSNCKEILDDPFTNVLTDIIQEKLEDKRLFILYDSSITSVLNLNRVLQFTPNSIMIAKHCNARNVSTHECCMEFCSPDNDEFYRNSLPSPEELESDIAIILTGKSSNFLNFSHYASCWKFKNVLVAVFESSCDENCLISTDVLQFAINLEYVIISYNDTTETHAARICTFSHFQPDVVTCRTWESLHKTSKYLFSDRLHSFNNEIIHLASDLDDFPFVYVNDDETVSGVSVDILKTFSERYKFSFTFTNWSSDEQWGEYENGTWNGLLRDIVDGGKNMTVNYLTLTRDRVQSFDHSRPFFYEGFSFAFKTPAPYPAWKHLSSPFSYSVRIIRYHNK